MNESYEVMINYNIFFGFKGHRHSDIKLVILLSDNLLMFGLCAYSGPLLWTSPYCWCQRTPPRGWCWSGPGCQVASLVPISWRAWSLHLLLRAIRARAVRALLNITNQIYIDMIVIHIWCYKYIFFIEVTVMTVSNRNICEIMAKYATPTITIRVFYNMIWWFLVTL